MRPFDAIKQRVGAIWSDRQKWDGHTLLLARMLPEGEYVVSSDYIGFWAKELAVVAFEFSSLIQNFDLVAYHGVRRDGRWEMQAVFQLNWR